MIKKIALFFLIPFFLAADCSQYGPKIEPFLNIRDTNGNAFIILSIQRSGLHWLSYSINQLTMRFVNPGEAPNNNRLETNFTREKAPIFTYHNPKKLEKGPYKLILLIRNYKENLIRNHSNIDSIRTHLDPNNNQFNLVTQLELFETIPDNDKLLIYYEDLIQYPETVLKATLKFLNESDYLLADFLDRIEDHKQYVINLYNKKWYGPSKTNGSLGKTHQSKLSLEDLKEIDQLIFDLNPYLYNKYLSRYL